MYQTQWKWKVKVKLLSCVQFFASPWTVVYQALPSMGFSRKEYWSGLPFPSPGNLPDPGVESPFTRMAPYSSTLAWKIPWTEEPGGLQSMGSRRVGHDWATSLSLFTFMHWRRKWQPTQVFLPGKSHGQRSLAGYSPCCFKESDMTDRPNQIDTITMTGKSLGCLSQITTPLITRCV